MSVRALVVDDSIFVRSMIRRQLERIGCTVVAEAENASQGLNLFRSLKPDLVTLDIVMAEADGIDSLNAFRAIRQEAPEVPVIMMTAMPFDESRETFMRAGAQDYILKPFNSEAFEQIRKKLAAIFPELNPRRRLCQRREPRLRQVAAMRNYSFATNLEQLMAAAAVNAAGALSRLLNDEVELRCLRVYYGDWREALLDSFHGRGNLLAFSQTAFGVETMTVSLVVEKDYVDRLLDMLMGRHGSLRVAILDAAAPDGDRFLSCEIDALKETTSIVTCICMDALSEQLNRGASRCRRWCLKCPWRTGSAGCCPTRNRYAPSQGSRPLPCRSESITMSMKQSESKALVGLAGIRNWRPYCQALDVRAIAGHAVDVRDPSGFIAGIERGRRSAVEGAGRALRHVAEHMYVPKRDIVVSAGADFSGRDRRGALELAFLHEVTVRQRDVPLAVARRWHPGKRPVVRRMLHQCASPDSRRKVGKVKQLALGIQNKVKVAG